MVVILYSLKYCLTTFFFCVYKLDVIEQFFVIYKIHILSIDYTLQVLGNYFCYLFINTSSTYSPNARISQLLYKINRVHIDANSN